MHHINQSSTATITRLVDRFGSGAADHIAKLRGMIKRQVPDSGGMLQVTKEGAAEEDGKCVVIGLEGVAAL